MGKLNKKGLEQKLAFKKQQKLKYKNLKNVLRGNRAKLIVKNLPFKATEENLQSLFRQYGEIESVNILKKPDGKLIGCAFIQFKLVQKAAKAQHYLNGHMFIDRKIEVDFAKSKKKYEKEKKINNVHVKPEDAQSVDLSVVKIEDDVTIKDEVKAENECDPENVQASDSESENKISSDSDSSSDMETSEETDIKAEEIPRKPHVVSNDVAEGKTVFIKNVPFSATKEDLRQCMIQFGPVYYALVCIDRLTEHSKGTAFVKFVNKEDADKCLCAGTELTLQGNILDCHPALHKQDLEQREKEKKVKQKDSRNLYLVKEGVILAGTKASEGVSASDMAKRLQLEQYKTQMLRNLNMYISKTRLIIHNLPPSWNDLKLKALFRKHSEVNAVIKEARTMRDMRNVDSKGVGKSKEYGFVTFTTHEDALHALRTLNNNPTIFSINKRPIVAFSIENRTALKAKEKRLQRSKMRNPICKDYSAEFVKEDDIKKNKQTTEFTKKLLNKGNSVIDTTSSEFSGVAALPGVKKMRSKYNLKTQAKLHFENLKQAKKKRKSIKTLTEKKKDFRKQPRQKIGKKKEETDSFSVLVNKYKQNLKSVPLKTSKWYE
ncbi:RNA binding protein [Oryctes borbonicus]|uniref:RNA binding protein n=1 Tax=Oryctes borbonicus TaxID=1629725 RepID=A0A0T6AX91_9SCAR|nr:RNA binding protein [Oryctes borbonicus]